MFDKLKGSCNTPRQRLERVLHKLSRKQDKTQNEITLTIKAVKKMVKETLWLIDLSF